MPLAANSKLGPYEIKSTLGVGGMGEVYRAHDSRLSRDVAIKVLREDGTYADQRSRFEREARAVAALNHPNIIAVYDFGIESGQQYIVSELLEGESLRALLKGGRVPVRRLIEISAQVADGLAAAHRGGIVHRDLKPENIMLAKDGRAKILDFGLARQTHTASSSAIPAGSDVTLAPANTQNLTSAGSVLGTAAYMSPEQALGQQTDYRSDQFSFGLILYEMAAGKQAFAKPSSIETMAAIVREEPPPMEEKLPPPLRWIIDRCLAKEPERRYESTRDLYRDLVNLRDHFSEAYTSQAFVPIAAAKAKAHFWKIPALCAACAVLAALLVYLLKPSGQDIGRYRYTPFASDAFSPVWSPDGKAVAYSGKVEGTYQVFVRYLNSPIPMQLTHEKYEVFPAGWSSDKSHLILQQSTGRKESPRYKLLSVATVGGDPEFIMDSDCEACDLSRDGKTFATFAKGKDGSYSVSISDPLGSPLRPYAPAPFRSKDIFNSPQLNFSADGKYVLLYRTGDEDKDEGWLLPFPPGSEPPQRILTKLRTFALPNFSWMPDDRHLVVSISADQNAPTHLWMADVESNRLTPLTTGTINESVPVVSPDGATILYVQRRRQFDVVSVSLEDGSTKTLVSTGREEDMPAWAASQPKLVWVTNRSGPYEIWVRLPDGSERPAVTAADFPPGTNRWFISPALSPDGDRLVYLRIDQAGVARLWISSLSGGAPVRLTNAEPTGEGGGSWSPDGRRVVYLSEQSGKTSLSIARASGNSLPVVVKSNGPPLKDLPQGGPEWSPTGDWITYRDRTGWNLISPDGRSSKFLGDIPSDSLAFSKDGKLLYGIHAGQTEADRNRFTLFSLDPVTLKQRVIKELGSDLRPATGFVMGIRFSLAPDGKSFVYSSENYRHDLWMLQGFRQPDWLAEIGNLLHK